LPVLGGFIEMWAKYIDHDATKDMIGGLGFDGDALRAGMRRRARSIVAR
jgi:hypothetical protein